jgi:hypothetical protein
MKTVRFKLDSAAQPLPAGRVNLRKLEGTSEADLEAQQNVARCPTCMIVVGHSDQNDDFTLVGAPAPAEVSSPSLSRMNSSVFQPPTLSCFESHSPISLP